MTPNGVLSIDFEKRLIKPFYMAIFFLMALTGFSQMPIFKRYYIADIPGLGWLAEYYITHAIHYLGAIALIVLLVYCAVIYLALLRRHYRLTFWAYPRLVLLGGILATGVLRVLKNLPDVLFSPAFTLFIDIAHLAFMMLFIAVAIVAAFAKSGWLQAVDR